MLDVLVLAGLHADAVDRTAHAMLSSAPDGTAVLTHDATHLRIGRLEATLRGIDGVLERAVVHLRHPCAACAVQEAMLPALIRLAVAGRLDRVVLVLPPGLEPEPAVRFLTEGGVGPVQAADVLRVHAVVTALDLARLTGDLDGMDTLAARGLAAAAGDDRCVAEVLIRQVEHADALAVLPGGEDETGLDLIAHLNPAAGVHPAEAAGRLLRRPPLFDPRAAALRSEPGAAFAPLREASGAVRSLVWQARRPVHPARLHHALAVLVPALLRTRGHVWLASQTDYRIAVSISGPRVEFGAVAPWIAGRAWRSDEAGHRARALLDWDDRLGDRGCHLVLTGIDVDVSSLRSALDAALLSDAEFAAGPVGWRAYADPFAPAPRQLGA